MDTKTSVRLPEKRTRRRHSQEFKAKVIAACLQPGISIVTVAQANGINANFLRSWVKAYREERSTSLVVNAPGESVPAAAPTLVPVAVQAAGDIQVEIRRAQAVVQIAWPTSQAQACAQWLREVLR